MFYAWVVNASSFIIYYAQKHFHSLFNWYGRTKGEKGNRTMSNFHDSWHLELSHMNDTWFMIMNTESTLVWCLRFTNDCTWERHSRRFTISCASNILICLQDWHCRERRIEDRIKSWFSSWTCLYASKRKCHWHSIQCDSKVRMSGFWVGHIQCIKRWINCGQEIFGMSKARLYFHPCDVQCFTLSHCYLCYFWFRIERNPMPLTFGCGPEINMLSGISSVVWQNVHLGLLMSIRRDYFADWSIPGQMNSMFFIFTLDSKFLS